MDSKPSFFRFFSGLARGCRPFHIIDTKGLIFINSKPISIKSSFSNLSRPIQVDHQIKIVSENFIRSNLRVSSRLPSTFESVVSADINQLFSTSFERILLKIIFPSSSSHDAACGSSNFESNFKNSIFGRIFQCRMERLLSELLILTIQLWRNKFKNDFILSIIYGVFPELFFRLHIFQVWRAFMFENTFEHCRDRCVRYWNYECHRRINHDKFVPHWRPYNQFASIFLDQIAFNPEYHTYSSFYETVPAVIDKAVTLPAVMDKAPTPLDHLTPLDLHQYLRPVISTLRLNDPFKVQYTVDPVFSSRWNTQLQKRHQEKLKSVLTQLQARLSKHDDPQSSLLDQLGTELIIAHGTVPTFYFFTFAHRAVSLFGPGYSSDNAGDGPADGIPPSNPRRFLPIRAAPEEEEIAEGQPAVAFEDDVLIDYPTLPTGDVCKYTPAYSSETFLDWVKDLAHGSGQAERVPKL